MKFIFPDTSRFSAQRICYKKGSRNHVIVLCFEGSFNIHYRNIESIQCLHWSIQCFNEGQKETLENRVKILPFVKCLFGSSSKERNKQYLTLGWGISCLGRLFCWVNVKPRDFGKQKLEGDFVKAVKSYSNQLSRIYLPALASNPKLNTQQQQPKLSFQRPDVRF